MSIQLSVLDRLMNGSKKGIQREQDQAGGTGLLRDAIRRELERATGTSPLKEAIRRELDSNDEQTSLRAGIRRELDRASGPVVLKAAIQRELDRASPASSRRDAINRVKESLLRDLEALLNTRQTASPPPRALVQVHRSIALYGLPDFSGERNPDRIASLIRSAIDRFEPRLNVKVQAIPGSDPNITSSMRFRISGSIRLRPTPEPVTYDTVVEIGTGQCRIEGGGNA